MPPRPKSVTDFVDGVHYSHNLACGMVVIGTGLVSTIVVVVVVIVRL